MVGWQRAMAVAVTSAACVAAPAMGSTATAESAGCAALNDPLLDRTYGTVDGFSIVGIARGDIVTANVATGESYEVSVGLVIDELPSSVRLFSGSDTTPITFVHQFDEAVTAQFGFVVGSFIGSDSAIVSFECAPDADVDGIPDDADPDDDNDGQPDVDELECGSDPLDASDLAADIDDDGIADCVDQNVVAPTTTAPPTTTTVVPPTTLPPPATTLTPPVVLPATGGRSAPVAVVASVLAGAGAAALWIARRRPRHEH